MTLTCFVTRVACSQVVISFDNRWKVVARSLRARFGRWSKSSGRPRFGTPPLPRAIRIRRRAALSDARLPGRSSAFEAVGEIALWRVPGLARFAPARILPGPCTPTACIAHLLSCSPCLGSAWEQCSMLALLLHAHLPLVTVHLWRVELWLEYFWRVRYAAISLLVPVGELTPLQSTSISKAKAMPIVMAHRAW